MAYGIKKLRINAIVEDDLVSVEEVMEKIQALEEFVQSVTISVFVKA